MYLTPPLRKSALLAHIAFSVGWFGAVIPYIALAITGLVSRDAQTVRSAYVALELIGWFVIVPLGIAALFSGLVQSLGTQWGLLRYWWIVAKLALTVVAVIILVQHMRDVSRVAQAAKDMMLFRATFRPELVHSIGGLLAVLAAMTISVFKPWGLTPYGRRQGAHAASSFSREHKDAREPMFTNSPPRVARILAYHALALVLLFAILHTAGMHLH